MVDLLVVQDVLVDFDVDLLVLNVVVVDLLVLNVVVVDLLVVQDVVVDLLVLLDSVVLVVVDQEVGFKVGELVFQLVVVLRFEFHDVVVVVWNLIVRG